MGKKYHMFDATNASLKMYELLMRMNLVDCATLKDNALNSFSNAELPGAFVIAINYYLKSKCPGKKFNWLASSYLPTAAAAVGNKTILEDKLKLYAMNRGKWLMGPKPNGLPTGLEDITGDVTDPDTVISLGIAVKSRFMTTEGAVLYTSDAGIDVTKDYLGQEENTSAINYGQIISGLLALAPGGNFVTKQYTFFTPFSRSLIALVSAFFEEMYITKPATSRPGNSEIYLVGKGFKGISSDMIEALTERSELFKTLGVNPTTLGSLVTPEILATVDPILYKISQEFFINVQVKFINEYVDAYKQYGDNMDILETTIEKLIKDTEKNWLDENGVIAIKPEESLTWYLHNGKKMRGGDGGQEGTDMNIDVNDTSDDMNYPDYLENNDIQPGQIPGNVAGADDSLVEEEAVLLDETNKAGASEFQGANEFEGADIVGANAMIVGGSIVAKDQQEPSLLEFKEEIKVDTEQPGEENNSGKKTITMTT